MCCSVNQINEYRAVMDLPSSVIAVKLNRSFGHKRDARLV